MASSRWHDKAVLNSVFNPFLPLGEQVYDEEVPSDLVDEDESSCVPENVQESKKMELEAIKLAETGDINPAVELLDKALELTPDRPSVYNNRAQALRLVGNADDALKDLNMAIKLSNYEDDIIGDGNEHKVKCPRSVCQAYCQRALIHRLRGDDESALEDFQRAAKLGNQFAKSQIVAMNPYAAMCNRMLSDVVEKLRIGETSKPSPYS
ncbi:TTC36 (predicted) [Pycnogonum litorale]